MSAVMRDTQRHKCIFINRALRGRVALLHHQSQRHRCGQGARPRWPHRLAAWKEEIWGLWILWMLQKVTACSYIVFNCVSCCRDLTTTGGPDGCRDQLQKHQETWCSENWDGLHQPLSGERRLWQCREVGLTCSADVQLIHLISCTVRVSYLKK